MDLTDLKIYGLNLSVFAVSFTQIEMALKIILLLVSIGYTIQRIYELKDKNK
jgi:hypothetical protein